MKLRISFLIASTFLSFSAYTKNVPNSEIKKCMPDCVTSNITGLEDNENQSIARSLREGASIQYLIYSTEELNALGLNQERLSYDLNQIVRDNAKYFKENPNLKGTFAVYLKFYSGTNKNPYQYTLLADSKNNQQIESINEMIKRASHCNQQGFCGALILRDIQYIDSINESLTINRDEYAKFIDGRTKNGIYHYPNPKNPEELKPFSLILIMGTNGYLVEKRQLPED